jgi:hypothetical protein
MEVYKTIIAGLVVASISGGVGFIIKSKLFSSSQYLPKIPLKGKRGYDFIESIWHEYHFTFEPKHKDKKRWLAHAEIQFEIDNKLVVDGIGKFPTEQRKELNYVYRGQVNSGNLYYTAVCTDDPDDAYCALFRNINDDLLFGVINGLDYSKQPFASPLILSKKPLRDEQVVEMLENSDVKFFAGIPS